MESLTCLFQREKKSCRAAAVALAFLAGSPSIAALGAGDSSSPGPQSKGAGRVGCSGMSYEVTQFDSGDNGALCQGSLRCNPPIEENQSVTVLGGCDPTTTSCSLTVEVEWLFRGNHQNPDGGFASMSLHRPDGVQIGSCGSDSDWIPGDRGIARFDTGLSCAEAETAPPGAYTYTLFAFACPFHFICENITQANVDVAGLLVAMICPQPPPPPPSWDCGTDSCNAGCFGPSGGIGGGGFGGSSAAGAPPTVVTQDGGPGATLRYRGGGAGHPDHPKPASWNATLGRFWSHDYAEAIVEDPDETHVWLLTQSATFREFTDAGGDGDYETAVPSDEYRRLTPPVPLAQEPVVLLVPLSLAQLAAESPEDPRDLHLAV
jgi:hypothetical protein